MTRPNILAFVAGAVGGLFVWLFSEPLTGRREPWDGAVAWYLLALFAIGLAATLIFRSRPFAAYWGAFAGQVLYGLLPFLGCILFGALCTDQANLFPLGAVMLLIYALPALIGALVARWVVSLLDARRG